MAHSTSLADFYNYSFFILTSTVSFEKSLTFQQATYHHKDQGPPTRACLPSQPSLDGVNYRLRAYSRF